MNSKPERIESIHKCPVTGKEVTLLGIQLQGSIHWINCDEYPGCDRRGNCPLGSPLNAVPQEA